VTKLLDMKIKIPKLNLTESSARLACLNPMRDRGKDVLKTYESTTATWEHKPKFEFKRHLPSSGSKVWIEVYTSDEIYIEVDLGSLTGPRMRIAHKKKEALTIPLTYTAKTVPGVIGSRAGGKSGEYMLRDFAYPKHIQARKFTERIKDKYYGVFVSAIETSLTKLSKEAFK